MFFRIIFILEVVHCFVVSRSTIPSSATALTTTSLTHNSHNHDDINKLPIHKYDQIKSRLHKKVPNLTLYQRLTFTWVKELMKIGYNRYGTTYCYIKPP